MMPFQTFFSWRKISLIGQCRSKIKLHVLCSLILDLHCPIRDIYPLADRIDLGQHCPLKVCGSCFAAKGLKKQHKLYTFTYRYDLSGKYIEAVSGLYTGMEIS